MIKKLVVAVFVLLGLSACQTISVANIRTEGEGRSRVEVAMPYDAAYRIIASESRRCFLMAATGVKVDVHADLYAESKSAEVSVIAAMMSSTIAEIVFDIRSTEPGSSVINVYYRKKSSESIVKAMKGWLAGDTTVCRVEE